MERLLAMAVFRSVADERSFAAAGRALHLSPAAVTRAVAGLEAHLGAKLLIRTTRRVRLTEAGHGYLVDCRRILGEIEEAEAAAGGAYKTARGELAITAPTQFGKRHLGPALLPFLESHPAVAVRLQLLDRVVDLLEEGIDVGVRIGSLSTASLVAMRLGEVRRVVVGSPAYLAMHGVPLAPADLAGHRLIAPTNLMAGLTWRFMVGGRQQAVPVRSRLAVSQPDVAIDAALAGFGLTRVPIYQVADELRQGRLGVVLEAFEEPPLPVSLVTVEGKRAAGKVRAFLDFMTPRLRSTLRDLASLG